MADREQHAPTGPTESTAKAEPAGGAPGSTVGRDGTLTQLGSTVLAFEKQRRNYPGAKDTAIREQFGMTPVRYYQVLNALIDAPAALAADPALVRQLQRLRAERARHRTARGSQI